MTATDFFQEALLTWFDKHGRKNLPWQHPRTPYAVWVSEIMLQQTQVKTVIPYFLKFMQSFQDVKALAEASEDEVLAHWSGLGYYRRGRNLRAAAIQIMERHQGVFPSDFASLIALPGIGASTANAILSLAFEKPAAILDGNVKRILSRYFLVAGDSQKKAVENKLMAHAKACLSQARPTDYSQAIMDLGALICTPKKPECTECPMRNHCLAQQNNAVEAYPEKITRKPKPTRELQFLLIHQNNKLYLEKQKLEGIWGGLWSLPTLEMDDCPHDYAKRIKANVSHKLPHFKHSFTHYHLMLYPMILTADTKKIINSGWHNLEQALALGLPKPIRQIITTFSNMDDVALFS